VVPESISTEGLTCYITYSETNANMFTLEIDGILNESSARDFSAVFDLD